MSRQTRIIAGTPKGTFPMASTDAAQLLTAAELVHSGGGDRDPVSAMITVEDYAIRYTVGDSTPTLVPALGHKGAEANVIYLECTHSIKTFKFLNAVTGEDATIQVTVGF